MRLEALRSDPSADKASLSYPGFLLELGEGRIKEDSSHSICLPDHIQTTKSTEELIDSVFSDVSNQYQNEEWINSRAILAATNKATRAINEEIGDRIPGISKVLRSADSVTAEDPEEQIQLDLRYPQELLNSLDTGSSMPDHEIRIKKGFVVMLLRNIRPKKGHVNGARYIVSNFTDSLLFLKSISGSHQGEYFILPRMNCLPGMEDFPIPGFKRCQFPVRVCFAMTINKAQGQSISGKLGLDLSYPCFSHGQLYVAMSRTTHPKNLFVLSSESNRMTKNIVYHEVFDFSKQIITSLTQECEGVNHCEQTKKLETSLKQSTHPGVCSQVTIIESCVSAGRTVTDSSLGCEFIDFLSDDSALKLEAEKLKPEIPVKANMVQCNSSIAEFELLYGLIPDRIRSFSITLTREDIESVLRPREWVHDTPILAMMEHLKCEDVYTVDTVSLHFFAEMFFVTKSALMLSSFRSFSENLS